jgi:hypothetical protein
MSSLAHSSLYREVIGNHDPKTYLLGDSVPKPLGSAMRPLH